MGTKDCQSRVKNIKQYEANLDEILKNKKENKAKDSKIVKSTNYGIATRYYYK